MGYLRSLPRLHFVVAIPSNHASYDKKNISYFAVAESDPLCKFYMSLWCHYFIQERIALL